MYEKKPAPELLLEMKDYSLEGILCINRFYKLDQERYSIEHERLWIPSEKRACPLSLHTYTSAELLEALGESDILVYAPREVQDFLTQVYCLVLKEETR